MDEPSVSVSRDIPVSAERIFSVLTRTATHPEVDGSGMLRGPLEDTVISAVGDVFAMNMYNDDMGDYVMENRVVEFEPLQRIVWEPILRAIGKPELQDMIGDPGFHRWGWELEPLDVGHTRVTEFFDCSRSPRQLVEVLRGGERWRPDMEASLENLARVVAAP